MCRLTANSLRRSAELPRLLLAAPCERALIDQDQNLSIISVLDTLKLAIPDKAVIPANVSAPLKWSIVTVWLREQGDEQKSFEQDCRLLLPNGTVANQSVTSFRLEKRTHRLIITMFGLPLVPEGVEYSVQVSIREAVDGAEWSKVATYPIRLEIERVAK
ncbi:MAG: hypothetical protein HY216_03705 [Candidatus Rokubacteria bacterium]|nr:hypothetical protein [Candidatus Rokubacteria bacterium]